MAQESTLEIKVVDGGSGGEGGGGGGGYAARGRDPARYARMIGDPTAAVGLLGRLGPYGAAAAGAIGLAGAAAFGTHRLASSEADRLRSLSPDLAVAQSQAQVRQLMMDMRQAQTLGPGLSRFVEAENKLSMQLQELILPIKKFLIETLAKVLERLNEWMEAVRGYAAAGIEALVAILEAMRALSELSPRKMLEILQDLPRRIAKAMEDARNRAADQPPDFLKQLLEIRPPMIAPEGAAGGAAARPPAGPDLGIAIP